MCIGALGRSDNFNLNQRNKIRYLGLEQTNVSWTISMKQPNKYKLHT